MTALAIAASLALAGCDVSGGIAIPRPAAAPGVVSAAGSRPSQPRRKQRPSGDRCAGLGSDGAGACAPGLWSAIKDHIDNPAVAVVGLVDGCRPGQHRDRAQ